MPTVASLLTHVPDARIRGDSSLEISTVVADSRRAIPGSLFVAVSGIHHDGAAFIQDAVARGASAVVSVPGLTVPDHVTHVMVRDPFTALRAIAFAFHRFPERSLAIVGVTGTDGKTSVAYLVSRMLSACGLPCGYLGTLGAQFEGRMRQTVHTTPPPPDLQELLGWMRDLGAQGVSLEASSHSLAQGRLGGLEMTAAVFTSLGRDHLDYHRTREAYLEAKLLLFDLLRDQGTAVVNADLAEVAALLKRRGLHVLTFSSKGEDADITVLRSRMELAGTTVELGHHGDRAVVHSPLLGVFQVENLAAAAAVGLAFGLAMPDIVRSLATVRHIPGRFEPVVYEGRAWAAVDYAHTPGALERALRSARALTRGRVIVVFGCGGDRDSGKRPLMGSVASRLADVVVLTSDNPRSEDPESIIRQIRGGCDGDAAVLIEPDRVAALAVAASQAGQGDFVLVAGKGHETTQTIGTRIIPLNDADELSRLRPGWAAPSGDGRS